jgi:kynurenine formamidase
MDQLWHSQIAVALIVTAVPSVSAQPLDLRNYEIVDLTHSLNEKTLFWPTSPSGFKLESLSHGVTPGGWFYAANTFCTPEHGGTHLDAPIHFDSTGMTVEKIPLDRLVAPAIVIDVVDACAKDDDYRLTVADVQRFEKQHGKISAGTIVILRTGWEHFWPDRKNYFGDDTPNDASKLHFPSFGAEAARLLVEERRVAAIGLDTPSIDYGQSTDFIVHRIAAAQNVVGLENLRGLGGLPATGATVFALPTKIEGGSGGPLRAIALVPKKR